MDFLEISRLLLDWYGHNARKLPWRQASDPYRIWLSEVMLQQTRVEAVISHYERFLRRFPTILSLAEAEESEALAAWSGLGYYSRGRRLHETAQVIVSAHAGEFPARPDQVRALPGIGDYTAGAILSIAFGQREPAVDGNVRRVFSRLAARHLAPRELRDLVAHAVPVARPGDFNQALMDLGSGVCTPRSPRCGACPIRSLCQAHRAGATEAYPAEAKRPKNEPWVHAVAWIRDAQGRVLLGLRPSTEELLPGLWHPPGIFLPHAERGEAIESLVSWARSTFGLELNLGPPIAEARHQITFHAILAHAHEATLAKPLPPSAALRWSQSPEAEGLAVSSLLGKLWNRLREPRPQSLFP